MLNRRNLLKAALSLPFLPAIESAATACASEELLFYGWFQIKIKGKETIQAPFVKINGRYAAQFDFDEQGYLYVFWHKDELTFVLQDHGSGRVTSLPIEWYRAKRAREPGQLLGPFPDHTHNMILRGWDTFYEKFG